MNWFELWLPTPTPHKAGSGTYVGTVGGTAQFLNPSDNSPFTIDQSQIAPGNVYEVSVNNKTDVLVEWTGSDGVTHATQVSTGMGYNGSNPLHVEFPS